MNDYSTYHPVSEAIIGEKMLLSFNRRSVNHNMCICVEQDEVVIMKHITGENIRTENDEKLLFFHTRVVKLWCCASEEVVAE